MTKLLQAMLVSVFLAAMPVQAHSEQICDLEGSVTITYKGQPDSKATSVAYAISRAEIDVLHKRALSVVDVASKVQDRGGDYMIEFDEVRRCGTEVSKGEGVAGVMVQGVTFRGVNRIAREFEKQFSATVKEQEQRAEKGKKRAFGRD